MALHESVSKVRQTKMTDFIEQWFLTGRHTLPGDTNNFSGGIKLLRTLRHGKFDQ